MSKIKYDKKEYSVRDSSCKKLVKCCFLPFSGNGQNICRRYELGQCPTGSVKEILKQYKNENYKNVQLEQKGFLF